MNEVTIISNGAPRAILDGWDVPATVRADFDYVDWDAVDEGSESVSFFRYRGEWYDLGDIPAVRDVAAGAPFYGWDGVVSDTFFSGVLVRFTDDNERVVVGRFYS